MLLPTRTSGACLALLLSQSGYAEGEIDEETGLIVGDGLESVKHNCTVCHSAKLISQNRADYHGWQETLRWMQETQGMQPLNPESEQQILNYLAKNYAPEKKGRRAPLVIDQWYRLENP